jgi:choline-glycine betaine transporter
MKQLKKVAVVLATLAAGSLGHANATTVGISASTSALTDFQGWFYAIAGILALCYLTYVAYVAKFAKHGPPREQSDPP